MAHVLVFGSVAHKSDIISAHNTTTIVFSALTPEKTRKANNVPKDQT